MTRKIKAGEWFKHAGDVALLLTTTPDDDGDLQIAVDLGNGEFASDYVWGAAEGRNQVPAKRQAWKAFRSAVRHTDIWASYRFYAFYSPNGRQAVIVAGCRAFTIVQAKEHWASRTLSFEGWEDERQRLNDWSLRYVAKLEAHLREVRAGRAT